MPPRRPNPFARFQAPIPGMVPFHPQFNPSPEDNFQDYPQGPLLPERQFSSFHADLEAHNRDEKQASTERLIDNPWERISKGNTIGKRAVINFAISALGPNTNANTNTTVVDILNVQSNNDNALQLSVCLSPPKMVKAPPGGFQIDIQNISTFQDNNQVDTTIGVLGNPVAIIEWGIGGISEIAEIDFLNGLNINVTSAFVRLKAKMENTIGDNLAYELSAFIGPGYPKDIGAQRSIEAGNLVDAGESAVFAVPRFAKKVYLLGNVGGVAGSVFVGHIRFWRDIAKTFPNGDMLFSANDHNPAPINNGSQFFTVINNSGAASRVVALFDLAI